MSEAISLKVKYRKTIDHHLKYAKNDLQRELLCGYFKYKHKELKNAIQNNNAIEICEILQNPALIPDEVEADIKTEKARLM